MVSWAGTRYIAVVYAYADQNKCLQYRHWLRVVDFEHSHADYRIHRRFRLCVP